MNQATAVMISWILGIALVLAVAAGLLGWYRAVRQRDRATAAEQSLRARFDELEHFSGSTMRLLADTLRRGESLPESPIATSDPEYGRLLARLAENYIGDLRRLQTETHERVRREVEYEAAQQISRAENEARGEAETVAREATSAAVRAFGTSVVSLGADVSQVVSAALREHRGDAVYATLTRIDHSVQQMIRQAQSYVIVCGGLPGRRWPQQSLTDVVGGATGRVRDFTRVRPQQLDRIVISRAVEPLVHTLATLMDNALRYSPPTSFVDVSFQSGHHGVTIIVDDAGVRMNVEQMEEARQVLAGERIVDIHQLGPAPRVGFPGVAALARRYGFTVYIDGPNVYGGMRAMVYVPDTLLAAVEPPAAAPVLAEPAVSQPESAQLVPEPEPEPEPEPSTVHEITPGGLPRRRRRTVAVSTVSPSSEGEEALPRPEIAAAWHTGSHSGRAAGFEHTEGITS